MFYHEVDQDVYRDPSEPSEDTQETYTFLKAQTPEGPEADSFSRHTTDTAETLEAEFDYLFEGEPNSPVQFSPPDMRDEDIDSSAASNEPTAVKGDKQTGANNYGCEEQEEPMMSGALTSTSDSGAFHHHDSYRHLECSKDWFPPRIDKAKTKDEAFVFAPLEYQPPEPTEGFHGETSRNQGSSISLHVNCARSFDGHTAMRSSNATIAEPHNTDIQPLMLNRPQIEDNERPKIHIYDPRRSFGLSRKQAREKTPTELDLERDDFQFHKLVEEIKSKHIRQALQGVDPNLSRQELFRIYRRAVEGKGDDFESYRPDTPSLEYDSDGLDDSPVELYAEDVSPCDDGESRELKRKSSCRRLNGIGRSGDIQQPPSLKMRTSSAGAVHQSLMNSKPYLSEITPTEAQGHHPSVIPRSPQRSSSRASSLSSETRLNPRPLTPEPQPLTQVALTRNDQETLSSSPGISLLSASLIERPPTPFRRPTEPASSTVQSSPLRKACDSVDASTTKEIFGSPAPTPSQPPSRPDTPRPSFAMQCIQEGTKVEDCPSFTQRHLQPAPIARSSAPSPSIDGTENGNMLNTPHVESLEPTRASTGVQNASGTLPTYLPPSIHAPNSTAEAQRASDWRRDAASATIAPTTLPDQRFMIFSSDNRSVAISQNPPSSADVSLENFPLQPLPGLSLQETLASVLASVSRDQRSAGEQPNALSPRNQSLDGPTTPYLDEPWREPVRAADNLTQSPSCQPVSPRKRSSQQPQRRSKPIEQLPPKKPSDPFTANNDMISFLPSSGSPPLSPLTGIAGQVYQSKRGQRKATAANLRAVSTRSLRNARLPTEDVGDNSTKSRGTRSKSTNIGVQGNSVKVTKTRAVSARSASRKGAITLRKKGVGAECIPDVPALPMYMDLDLPAAPETSSSQKKAADRKQKESITESNTPVQRTSRAKRDETPQAMDVDQAELQATPDVLEQLEREHEEGPNQSSPRQSEKTSTMNIAPKTPIKRTPSKRKPTSSRKKKNADADEAQAPKTPARTPRTKKDNITGGGLTPQSAEKGQQRQASIRRSPRLMEKEEKRQRYDAGIEVGFGAGHNVM